MSVIKLGSFSDVIENIRELKKVDENCSSWMRNESGTLAQAQRRTCCRYVNDRKGNGARQPVSVDYNTAHEGVSYITPQDLSASLDSFAFILDVQSKPSFVCSGHLPSPKVVNIPIHDFMSLTLKRVSELLTHKDDPVLVLSNGSRTAASVQMLLTNSLGFQNVRVLEGGMEAWRACGLPIEHGTDCAIINEHCPWIDNNQLLCSLQSSHRAVDTDTSSSVDIL